MGKKIILAGIFMFFTILSFGQQKENQTQEIKREVTMTNENGQKKLVIRTDNRGVISEEIFTGNEADEKLKEIEESTANLEKDGEKIEMRMEEVNGEKKLTVLTRKGSNAEEEVYYGEEAENKLIELQEKRGAQPVKKKVKQRMDSPKKSQL